MTTKKIKKRYFVASLTKPLRDGGVVANQVEFFCRQDELRVIIEDTIRDLINAVSGWKCGSIAEVRGFVDDQPIEVTAEMIARSRKRFEEESLAKNIAWQYR